MSRNAYLIFSNSLFQKTKTKNKKQKQKQKKKKKKKIINTCIKIMNHNKEKLALRVDPLMARVL